MSSQWMDSRVRLISYRFVAYCISGELWPTTDFRSGRKTERNILHDSLTHSNASSLRWIKKIGFYNIVIILIASSIQCCQYSSYLLDILNHLNSIYWIKSAVPMFVCCEWPDNFYCFLFLKKSSLTLLQLVLLTMYLCWLFNQTFDFL